MTWPSLTILAPTAPTSRASWRAERWAAVARRELAGGRRVLVLAPLHARAVAQEIADRANQIQPQIRADFRADRFSLRDLASMVSDARLVVAADNRVAHVAAALRLPCVLLCTHAHASRFLPVLERPRIRAMWSSCIHEIAVEDVLREMGDARETAREAERIGKEVVFSSRSGPRYAEAGA